jgi:hypothetical protein
MRFFDNQEQANEAACRAAAAQHGVLKRAEMCDDMELACPTCPWKATAPAEVQIGGSTR